MTDKEEAMAIFSAEYDAWAKSQEGQIDAYPYEKSFNGFMQRMGRALLQGSVGQEAEHKKNGTHQLRGN